MNSDDSWSDLVMISYDNTTKHLSFYDEYGKNCLYVFTDDDNIRYYIRVVDTYKTAYLDEIYDKQYHFTYNSDDLSYCFDVDMKITMHEQCKDVDSCYIELNYKFNDINAYINQVNENIYTEVSYITNNYVKPTTLNDYYTKSTAEEQFVDEDELAEELYIEN